MFIHLKHQVIKTIEKIPLLQIFIYNNLKYFNFLFPHDKDYYALQILFKHNEKKSFLDVGGNIGLSSIGFRELGFRNNKIHIFEPDKDLIKFYLNKIKKNYLNLTIHPFGLSNKNYYSKLYKAFYKNVFFHFNNSFSKTYIKKKLFENYGTKSKEFKIKSSKFKLKKFDDLKIKDSICFIKIDVEGLDHLVLYGMRNCIKKNLPVILVEYNFSNFDKIYVFLKKKYECYFYNFDENKLKKLKFSQIQSLKSGNIIENKFKKNSVNIFFIKKK
tara:strand:- start:684 stop:1499 length:816 start_codon:yes stop_codon:yes gene_type:complete